jgi:dipeptidyl aminopeptidase/acylaminoacyl peptidase
MSFANNFGAVNVLAKDADKRLFQPEDMHRIKSVGDIVISPDGAWVAYSVGSTNVDKDESASDLFMVSWDGSTRIQLTRTEDPGESNPRFSPDGKYLAFIAARTDGKTLYFLLADDRVQSVASAHFRGGDVEVLYPDRAKPGVAQSFAVSKTA